MILLNAWTIYVDYQMSDEIVIIKWETDSFEKALHNEILYYCKFLCSSTREGYAKYFNSKMLSTK